MSGMTWEEFVNIDKFRLEYVFPRGQPQAHRVSRGERVAKTTPGASTFGTNPPATELAIEIGSSKLEYSDEESSSSNPNANVLPKTTIRTRAALRKEEAQMREEESRKGKAKKPIPEKVKPIPRKRKVDDTSLPAAEEKHKSPPKKFKPPEPTTDMPPKRSPRFRRSLRKEAEAPKGQVNVEVKDIFEEQANIRLAELAAIAEQVENKEPRQPEQDEQKESFQLVLFEKQEPVRGKILVGKHKPPTFS